ncbi:sensor histidine kinase [Cohnella pontilimi]|uniref:Sensor histidine kinase n=1 Tax=Cohnella pontilimi TaxID=2564100 RepID=A0A4U0FEX8_9BACL|nr:histidine kinase [Cohnella pontilimi]TJY43503.1 sensor histidine kinase [Cohnella pontilimi]
MTQMKRRLLLRNFLTFLLPTLIPVLLLGTLSSVIIQQYVKSNIQTESSNILNQTKSNVELILNELDSLNVYFMTNAVEFVRLKALLQKPKFELDDYAALATIKNYIDAPAMARPFIDSIYIYLDNDKKQFITSSSGGFERVDSYYDDGWYQSYLDHNEPNLIWTEMRSVKKSTFSVTDTQLITIYRKLSLSSQEDGVIVLNIDPKYIENLFHPLSTLQNQQIFIISRDGQILANSGNSSFPQAADAAALASVPYGSIYRSDSGMEPLYVFKAHSDKYGWTFYSTVPRRTLYSAPNTLTNITLGVILISLLIGTTITFMLNRKNRNDLRHIVNILQLAQQGKPLPEPPEQVKDVYSYITHGILTKFIEQHYLTAMLSERKQRARVMELQALQAQLNPHFLFNTLETLSWKVVSLTGKPNEANRMIDNLAKILRYALDGNPKNAILQKEIKFTQSYIDIQKVQYKDKFDVQWAYSPDVLKYNVPKLLLQPLIENSLYHGIKEKEGPCKIKVKIRKSGDELIVTVLDNGIGMSREKLREVETQLRQQAQDNDALQASHIGLSNTHKRLVITYGENYGLIIRSKTHWGTVVRCRIPI